MSNVRWLLVGLSGLLVLVGFGLSVLVHRANPFLHPDPFWDLEPLTRELASATTGVLFALFVVVFTRVAVRRTSWARRLHQDLRPVAQQLSPSLVLLLAALSSLGEELLFRSLLVPWIGIVPQAVVFGLFHQVPGRSRWVWVAWAGIAGLVFGGIYELFGSLTGPVLSHGLINAVNLTFLRDHDPEG